MNLEKLPPIIVLPFVLVVAGLFIICYITVAIVRMFLWGKPAAILDEIIGA